jgi:beta-lactamase regulating signal transducer with metallopeptidase domain
MNTLESLFQWLLTASLRASILIVPILAVRWLFRPWLPAGGRYALWFPLLLVLLSPFFPSVPFHPFSRTSTSVVGMKTDFGAAVSEGVQPDSSLEVVAAQNWNPLAVAWLFGTCVVLAVSITAYRKSLIRIRNSAAGPDAGLFQQIVAATQTVGLRSAPEVWLSSEVESPAVTGFGCRILLLPARFPTGFTPAESRLILLHELSHLKRHDLPLNWLICFLQALHWFNPILWVAFWLMREDRESACDARVLALDCDDHRTAYGHALLKLQGSMYHSGPTLGFIGLFQRGSGIRVRIRDISRNRRSQPAWNIVCGAIIAVLTLGGATTAQETRQKVDAEVPAKDPRQIVIENKLDGIIVSNVDFEDSTLQEATDFLQLRARELDKVGEAAGKAGVDIHVRLPQNGEVPRIKSLALKGKTLRQILERVAELADMNIKIDASAVTLFPKDTSNRPRF